MKRRESNSPRGLFLTQTRAAARIARHSVSQESLLRILPDELFGSFSEEQVWGAPGFLLGCIRSKV